jgi:phosphoglycerate dehydrogenase-like enzyme
MGRDTFAQVFDGPRLRRLGDLTRLVGAPLLTHGGEPADGSFTSDGSSADEGALRQVEVLITSWGAPRLTAARLDRLPRLRAVFHCAGSVRELVSEAFWERNLIVTTAADANAVPVAEFTFATIVLANKGALRAMRAPLGPASATPLDPMPPTVLGNLGRRIGVVGFSRIGRRVVDLLGALDDTEVLVADPHVDAATVAAAGARLLPLAEVLPQVDVLTLHAPALPSTRRMIGASQLAALRDGATLINTARGALVDHDALAAECRTGRLNAVLDVTEPEPLPRDSELLGLRNVVITPHLAGSLGSETRRLVDSALDDLEAWVRHGAAPNRVTAVDLAHSA